MSIRIIKLVLERHENIIVEAQFEVYAPVSLPNEPTTIPIKFTFRVPPGKYGKPGFEVADLPEIVQLAIKELQQIVASLQSREVPLGSLSLNPTNSK